MISPNQFSNTNICRPPSGRSYDRDADLRPDLVPVGTNSRSEYTPRKKSGRSITFTYAGWPLRVEYRTLLMIGSAVTTVVDPIYYQVSPLLVCTRILQAVDAHITIDFLRRDNTRLPAAGRGRGGPAVGSDAGCVMPGPVSSAAGVARRAAVPAAAAAAGAAAAPGTLLTPPRLSHVSCGCAALPRCGAKLSRLVPSSVAVTDSLDSVHG